MTDIAGGSDAIVHSPPRDLGRLSQWLIERGSESLHVLGLSEQELATIENCIRWDNKDPWNLRFFQSLDRLVELGPVPRQWRRRMDRIALTLAEHLHSYLTFPAPSYVVLSTDFPAGKSRNPQEQLYDLMRKALECASGLNIDSVAQPLDLVRSLLMDLAYEAAPPIQAEAIVCLVSERPYLHSSVREPLLEYVGALLRSNTVTDGRLLLAIHLVDALENGLRDDALLLISEELTRIHRGQGWCDSDLEYHLSCCLSKPHFLSRRAASLALEQLRDDDNYWWSGMRLADFLASQGVSTLSDSVLLAMSRFTRPDETDEYPYLDAVDRAFVKRLVALHEPVVHELKRRGIASNS